MNTWKTSLFMAGTDPIHVVGEANMSGGGKTARWVVQ